MNANTSFTGQYVATVDYLTRSMTALRNGNQTDAHYWATIAKTELEQFISKLEPPAKRAL